MIENMWNLEDEEVLALPTPPEKIVEEQCELLGAATDYVVKAKIAPYSGSVESYRRTSLRALPGSVVQNFMQIYNDDRFVDIQEDLGDIGSSYFAFEFFIVAPSIPNYKYRVMFMQYKIEYYPLLLVLDDEIATEINFPVSSENSDEILSSQNVVCENEEQFIELLRKVITSKKVRKVVASLKRMANKALIV